MKRLVVCPSFHCPFNCSFCFNRHNIDSNELLPLETVKEKVSAIIDKVSEIVISGGEPMSLDKNYFDNLVDVLKTFGKTVTVECYPYDLTNYRDDVEYNFSYDFTVRPRALEAWENLMAFKKPFNITVTLSPVLFKFYPNGLLWKLTLLDNLKEVEFKPYCKNVNTQYDITKNSSLLKFNQLLLSNKLNLPFVLKNKTKLISKMLGNEESEVDLFLMPSGELKYQDFEDDLLVYKDLTLTVLNDYTPLVYPDDIDMYSKQMMDWARTNGIV